MTEEELLQEIDQFAQRNGTCLRRNVGAMLLPAVHSLKPIHMIDGIFINLPAHSNLGFCKNGGCPRGLLSLEERPAYGNYTDCTYVHAEAYCLLNHQPSERLGGTLFVSQWPCMNCAKLIAVCGVWQLVTYMDQDTPEEAHELLLKSGVTIRQYYRPRPA